MKKIIGIFVMTLLITTTVLPSVSGKYSDDVFYNQPPVADAGGPYEGVEGIDIMFDASASSDPDGDELMFRWDFDCDEIWDTEWSHDPIAYYAYGDDYDYLAFVEVSDGIDSTYASSHTFIVNADPEVDAGPDQIVNVGETVIYNGFFDDLGVLDSHVFSWGFSGLCPDEEELNATVTCVDFRRIPNQGFRWTANVTTNGERIFDLHFILVWEEGKRFSGSDFPEPPENKPSVSTDTVIHVNFNEPLPDQYQFKLWTNHDKCTIYWYTSTSGGEYTNNGVMSTPNSPIGPFEMVYDEPGFYNSVLTIFDDDGGSDTDMMTVQVIDNLPPISPSITGKTNGKAGVEYEYQFESTDPNGDNIIYCIIWGDGSEEEERGPWPSGETTTAEHTWTEEGAYTIKAKAKDTNGLESDWTSLEVSMPRSKPYTPLGFIFAFGFDVDVKIVQLEPGEDYVDLEVLSKPFYIWENEIITRNPGEFIRLHGARGLFSPSLPICFGICEDWDIIG